MGFTSGNASATGGDLSDPGQQYRRRWRGNAIVVGLVCLHVPAAIYLAVWHQSGALSAVDVVARRVPVVAGTSALCASVVERRKDGSDAEREVKGVAVHFLMPCHAAPLHSHLHFRDLETSLWSLDCSPE